MIQAHRHDDDANIAHLFDNAENPFPAGPAAVRILRVLNGLLLAGQHPGDVVDDHHQHEDHHREKQNAKPRGDPRDRNCDRPLQGGIG